MPLPSITGEFGVIDLDLRFSEKGTAWVKIRAIAKDRVRDNNGQWTDGDPLFIDIVVNNGAEHLCESVTKGDSVIVTGRLKQRTWEKDGQKQTAIQINADSVGVSTRWGPAKTAKALETTPQATVQAALGATVIDQPDEAPF